MDAGGSLLSLYFDGVTVPATYLPHAADYTVVDIVQLPAEVSVIAAAATAAQATGGGTDQQWLIAAALLGRVITNSSWRCSEVEYSHWMMPTYDSSWWLPAAIKNVSATPQQLALISSTAAVGIWSQNAAANTVYCRLDISE